jgi:endo-1,4-beta-xylanase
MKITGAHLLWHLSTPKFFEAAADTTQARKLVVDHITYMCKRLAGQVWSWNVVNEALNPREGRPGGLRGSPLVSQLGADFFDIAFHTAREADPKALLVYNDYAMELDTSEHESRRRALLALIDSFKKRNLPIDAIGLQSHMRLDQFRFEAGIYRRFLKEIAARGVKILITELDVFDVGAPSDIKERDQAVADCYQRVLDVALDETAVTAVVTWGLSDRYTWLTPRYSPKFTRPDGLPGRPLPFDEQFAAKAAYGAIAKTMGAAPERRPG